MRNILILGLVTTSLLAGAQNSLAQSYPEDEVVATGMSVRQGGAQDIKHFRGEVDRGNIPSPQGMTSEGLLGEHDLFISSNTSCRQTLCLNAAAMPASIINADYFAGLGFDSNISQDWDREPINLVAVIDRSGSMDGESIKNVKHSLLEITKQLRPKDQISLVLYGSDVVTHLKPLPISNSAKSTLKDKIKRIKIEGSTNMDAGLARAYDIAYQTMPEFEGHTRLMIFTDERPNVGRTDAEGFMQRAKRASKDGIGLTTIGYGVNYGGDLAAKIASVRGGNLFYVGDKEDVNQLFTNEFDYMVSELAHDLRVKIRPAKGLELGQVYGVPERLTSRQPDGAIVMTIPTVFLSSQSGGLFVSLTGEHEEKGQPLFYSELQYKKGELSEVQKLEASLSNELDSNLQKAEALSAQYTAMKTAAEAYYSRDYDKAFEIFNPFAKNYQAHKIKGLETEYELVVKLNEKFAIDAQRYDALDEIPKFVQMRGSWEVTKAKNMLDVKRGDRFEFSPQKFTHYKKTNSESPYDTEYYRVNEKQIYLTKSDLTFRYSINKKGRLILRHPDGETVIYLNPASSADG